MIKGIGTDIIEVDRIKRLFMRHNLKSLETVFTTNELKSSDYLKLAGHFAAKEALSKAFGTGMIKDLWFNKIDITFDDKPKFFLNKELKKFLAKYNAKSAHLSITYTKKLAIAFVIIE